MVIQSCSKFRVVTAFFGCPNFWEYYGFVSYFQIQFSAFMFATGTSAVNTQVYTATLEVCLGTSCAAYVSQ